MALAAGLAFSLGSTDAPLPTAPAQEVCNQSQMPLDVLAQQLHARLQNVYGRQSSFSRCGVTVTSNRWGARAITALEDGYGVLTIDNQGDGLHLYVTPDGRLANQQQSWIDGGRRGVVNGIPEPHSADNPDTYQHLLVYFSPILP